MLALALGVFGAALVPLRAWAQEGAAPPPPPTASPAAPLPAGVDDAGEGLDEESEEVFLEQIRVYQQKPFMRKLRFELAPLGGLSVNDALVWYYSAGVLGRFHINEQFAVGASYRKYFYSDRDVVDEIEDGHGVFPERRFRDFYAGGEFSYTPIIGKFALFDSIVHVDAYVTGGLGVMRTYERGAEGDNLMSWNLGVGSRVVLTEWLTFTLELRDYMYIEPYRGGDTFINDVALQAGLSVFFPFSYSYRYPK